MAQANVAVRTGAYAGAGERIGDTFFGGNTLFDRDSYGEDGTYADKADALNIDFFRYPGGTITELHFDVNDPDAEIGDHGRALTGLTEHLRYVASEGGTTSLVLPSIRYIEALKDGSMSKAAIRAEISAFLEKLARGDFGDASVVTHVELGNEFYDESVNPNGTPAEYGQIARLIAEEVREALGGAVKIGVQAGRNNADNQAVLDAFQGADRLVDTVIVHDYPWNFGSFDQHNELKSFLWNQWLDSGLAEEIYLSEWSLSNQYKDEAGTVIGSDQIDDGLARAAATIELASRYVALGVDHATIWPVQQNTRGDLAGDAGQTAETDSGKLSERGLTPVGEAFRLMSEVLPGMRMLDIDGNIDVDGKRESKRFENEALVQGFEDSEKVVLFVSAWNLPDELGSLELKLNIDGAYVRHEVTTLTIAGDDYTNPNADPFLFEESGGGVQGGLTVTFDRDYEVKRIVLIKDEADVFARAVRREEVLGSRGDDTLEGGDGHEALRAKGGDDLVRAGAGDDDVFGGGGSDALIGGNGADMLKGGGGDDRLAGSKGADILIGGGGGDRLKGGGQDDELSGGGGSDTLIGGGGTDEISGGAGDDRANGGRGDDDISGGEGFDFVLGGAGVDTLSGGGGADTISGGQGDDFATGGGGGDLFLMNRGDSMLTIGDFSTGDTIQFAAADRFADLSFDNGADGVAVSFRGETAVLLGVSRADLSADDFVF